LFAYSFRPLSSFFFRFICIYSLKGAEYEDLAVDLYVILKVSFPLLIDESLAKQSFVLGVMVYVMLETILYIPTLILPLICFQNRVLTKDRCYYFSLITEMVFGFAVLYSTLISLTNHFRTGLILILVR
jgi:hypothetical protein